MGQTTNILIVIGIIALIGFAVVFFGNLFLENPDLTDLAGQFVLFFLLMPSMFGLLIVGVILFNKFK